MVDDLKRLALKLGCRTPQGAPERLAAYADLIQRWNRRKRIVGSRNPEEIIGIHLADCMAFAGRLQRMDRPHQTLLDVGSGAGLPGLALSLLLPSMEFSLCEVSEKRVAFLHHARRVLDARIDILHEDVNVLVDRSIKFDHAVSRAVFEPNEWLDIGRRCVHPNGNIWCMLTDRQQEQCQLQGEMHRYTVGGDRKRVLIKVSPHL
jgi:16S rRNA (guanine527-N7)-methyltransferase